MERTTAKVELGIGEVMELIDYHHGLADSLDKAHEDKTKKTAAGTTIGEVITKHRKRARELHTLLDETWPK